MTPLDGALALTECDHAAHGVAQHLDLDVARRRHELLDVRRPVAERRVRFRARGGERALELRLRGDDPPLASRDIETDAEGHPASRNATTMLAGRHRLSLDDAPCVDLAMRRGAALAALDAAMHSAATAAGIALLPA